MSASTVNYRCTKPGCRTRTTLRKPKEHYVRKHYTLCPGCGRDSLSMDPEPKRRHKQNLCRCDGFTHINPRWNAHQRGSEPWCIHAKIGPSDRDYEEIYGDRRYA